MPIVEFTVPTPPPKLERMRSCKSSTLKGLEVLETFRPFFESLKLEIIEKAQLPLWRFQTLSPEIMVRQALLT